MKTTPPRILILGLVLLLAAAVLPAAAQETSGHTGRDKAAQPATSAEAAAPAQADTSARAEAPASAAGRVTIGFGTGIDRATRELVGEAASFAGGDTVWCRTVLQGLAHPTTVTHAWYHEGRTLARVELDVGSAHWRTWSAKIILPDQTGPWEVKVLDAAGSVLEAGTFEIRQP
ncbi:MAG: DUF2914 domain-containing protein [Candidatus Krumholzibacteriia bacterium]